MSLELARALRTATRAELRARLLEGYPIDPTALEGYLYRGTSLGLPWLVEQLTWKTFQKAFWRHPDGRLRGWNVRLAQDGLDAPSRPKLRRGRALTTWPYGVVAPDRSRLPGPFARGLVIDYSLAPNPPWQRLVKDPLVALAPNDADALLGVSYLFIAGRAVATPTYFTLEREQPIGEVPDSVR